VFDVSDEFLAAIRASHTMVVQATAYRGGYMVPGGQSLQVLDGTVRADGGSSIRRSVEGLRVASPDGRTETLHDILDERAGTELQVSRGVVYTTGRIELAPVARVRVDGLEDDLSEPGVVAVSGQDRAARVIDDKFLTPRAAAAGTRVTAQITSLIQESIPNVAVWDDSGSAATVPGGIVWEQERWDAVSSLADAISCTVYADPRGDFRIAPVPTFDTPAAWTIDAGAGAVLLGGQRSRSREGVHNVVVATSSPTDGAAPVVGIAQDTDPLSPTRVGGPFGRVPRFYSSAMLATQAQAQAAAKSLLDRSLGSTATIALTSMVNPALEVGDRINVVFPDGVTVYHIADGFDVPLTPEGPMPVQTRAARPSGS
jgi:hypothetical protein